MSDDCVHDIARQAAERHVGQLLEQLDRYKKAFDELYEEYQKMNCCTCYTGHPHEPKETFLK